MHNSRRFAFALVVATLALAGCSASGGPASAEPAASIPPGAEGAVAVSTTALAAELGVDEGTIAVVSVEPTEWADTSLGCPEPGVMYAQVITPGFVVTLDAGGTTYAYHTDSSGQRAVTCGG